MGLVPLGVFWGLGLGSGLSWGNCTLSCTTSGSTVSGTGGTDWGCTSSCTTLSNSSLILVKLLVLNNGSTGGTLASFLTAFVAWFFLTGLFRTSRSLGFGFSLGVCPLPLESKLRSLPAPSRSLLARSRSIWGWWWGLWIGLDCTL